MAWFIRRSKKISPGLTLRVTEGRLGVRVDLKHLGVGIGPKGLYISGGIPIESTGLQVGVNSEPRV